MKKICEDYMNYGTEKDISDYTLDTDNKTLEIHTLCIERGVGSTHTTKLCKLTDKQAQLLDNMSESDCKDWCLKYQHELPVISRE